jgi:FkbM family methyltransferase
VKDETYDSFLAQQSPIEGELAAIFPSNSKLVIFDIGACEGEDSIRYSRLFPEARIFSFEPLPSNQALIEHHFARHGVERCELVTVALSDRSGTAEFFVSSGAPETKDLGEDWNYGNKSNSLLPPGEKQKEQVPWLKFEDKVTVQTETLDHFCEERNIEQVDFLHMDVQGAEWLVLQGAQKTLPKVKALWLEVANEEVYQGQKVKKDIEDFLSRNGFGVTFEVMRGTEGDQFYVNKSLPNVSHRIAANEMKRLGKKARSYLRRLKAQIVRPA